MPAGPALFMFFSGLELRSPQISLTVLCLPGAVCIRYSWSRALGH